MEGFWFAGLALIMVLGFGVLFWGLQRPILDLTERLTERVVHSATETRQAMSDRLNQQFTETRDRLGTQFLEMNDRLERALASNRQEQRDGLMKTTAALEVKFQALEQQVGTRLEAIGKNVEHKLNENLKEGFKHFEKVQQHLKEAELKLQSLTTVGQSISDLNNLLKLPHLRGRFGEGVLERILADFLPAGSFELQYQVTPGSTEKVDAVVKLAKQVLPIDSKFPRESVLPLFETHDPEALEGARKELAAFVKQQARSIKDKYIRPDHGTTDMAMLFLPSETLYLEVVRNGALFDEVTRMKVYPVSPNTLVMGLRSIVMAQEYYEMSRGVEKTIEDLGKARKHFASFEDRFEDVEKGLKKAQEAYEKARTHLGRYGSSVQRLTGSSDSPASAIEDEAATPATASAFALTSPDPINE